MIIIKMLRRPLRKIYEERSKEEDFCPLNKINPRFIELLLLKEDDAFYSHRGISQKAIRDAIKLNAREHRIVTSGSTITQQLIKNLYFRFNKTYTRKISEALMALLAEKILTKDEILELYINIIYYGCGTYGITDAAEYYFSVKPEDMSFNQIFMINVFLNAPTARNPLLHPDKYVRFNKILADNWRKREILSDEEIEIIETCRSDRRLDPQLRESAAGVSKYGKDILINERFGMCTDFGARK